MAEQGKGLIGGLTITGIAAALALWPEVQQVLGWVWDNIGPIMGRMQVQAVLASLFIAAFAGCTIPKWAPSTWPSARTRAVSGTVSALLALSAAVAMVPTRIGFVYAVLAAFASPTVNAVIRKSVHWGYTKITARKDQNVNT